MKKLRNCRGFTLTEMLCVTLILALVGCVAVTGIGLSLRAWQSAEAAAGAQVLCATLASKVKQELPFATQVSVQEDAVCFYSPSCGEVVCLQSLDGRLLLGTSPLISPDAYLYGLQAQIQITYSDSTAIFTVQLTITDAQGEVLEQSHFQVQRLNEGSEGDDL